MKLSGLETDWPDCAEIWTACTNLWSGDQTRNAETVQKVLAEVKNMRTQR